MPIYLEQGHPHVVRASFVDVPSDEDLEAYFHAAESLLRERAGTRFVTLLDARSGGTPPVEQLRMHAAFLKRNADSLAAGLYGVLFAASRPMVRGAVRALFWMQASPVPCLVIRELSEADDAARPWFEAAKVPVEFPTFDLDPTARGRRVRA
ncbi:MAG: hypothetical protein AAGA54_31700 [Myxococcota bacterium]